MGNIFFLLSALNVIFLASQFNSIHRSAHLTMLSKRVQFVYQCMSLVYIFLKVGSRVHSFSSNMSVCAAVRIFVAFPSNTSVCDTVRMYRLTLQHVSVRYCAHVSPFPPTCRLATLCTCIAFPSKMSVSDVVHMCRLSLQHVGVRRCAHVSPFPPTCR